MMPLLVRGLERLGDLARDRQRFVDRKRPRRFAGRVLAFDELHDERERTAALLSAVDLRDVGMIEGRERAGFAIEAGDALGIAGDGSGRTLIATSRCSFVSRAR